MAINETNLLSQNCESDCSLRNTSSSPETTEDVIQTLIPQVIQGQWANLSYPLSEWQQSQLEHLNEHGISCMLRMWLINQVELLEGTYCNATWDSVYCWPPTMIGNVAARNCSEVLKELQEPHADQIEGTATRVCLENATWLSGNWTNYTQCVNSYEQFAYETEEEEKLVRAVQFIIFLGSIFSFICLGASLAVFYYFKVLRCDRVTVHVHLMMALLLRSVMLFIITEPFIFNRPNNYRTEDFTCKTVLSLNLYATVASINWMFIQGLYLHGKLTTNVFDKGTPFKTYYAIGWILPLGLVGIYAWVMETYHPVKCWMNYSERPELWILLAPILLALLANCIFLINIMRILLTKARQGNLLSETSQFRRAIKATLILFPLLGVNNLLFVYNPGGEFNKYFVILNSLCGSTQGIFVAILYCFVSRDVREAIRREYIRFLARRGTNIIQHGNIGRGGVHYQRHSHENSPRIHFRSLMAPSQRASSDDSGARHSGTTTMQMVSLNRFAKLCQDDRTSSSSSLTPLPSFCIHGQRYSNLNNNLQVPHTHTVYRCFNSIPFTRFHCPDGR
ncbi:unnamed protein product [Orchesella dallaii]|uniref:PDF receptor n=1 Tax=Orchesella dallaii TaxID=48710 RepID=A0ABP1S7G2_9HEXA